VKIASPAVKAMPAATPITVSATRLRSVTAA
jgi:hypothetical protein